MEEESKNPIQVAEKLFRVIELLAENGPMGIMELSASLGFHKSTVHRLVASLQHMGYIRQDEESLKYSLSLKFLEIGSRILEQTSMAALIHPSLKRLSEQTGETVHLVKREGTEAVYIDKVESFASSIRMVSRVGSRIPLYCSGVGKALLAELTDREIGEIWKNSRIRKLTPRTITELPVLMERVEQVRKDGYAVDDEENEEGRPLHRRQSQGLPQGSRIRTEYFGPGQPYDRPADPGAEGVCAGFPAGSVPEPGAGRKVEVSPGGREFLFLIHLLFNVLKFIMKVCEKQGRIKYGRKSRNQDPEIHGRK